MNKEYSAIENNQNFLNALSLERKIKVDAIEDANSLYDSTIRDCRLFIMYEMNGARRNPLIYLSHCF